MELDGKLILQGNSDNIGWNWMANVTWMIKSLYGFVCSDIMSTTLISWWCVRCSWDHDTILLFLKLIRLFSACPPNLTFASSFLIIIVFIWYTGWIFFIQSRTTTRTCAWVETNSFREKTGKKLNSNIRQRINRWVHIFHERNHW